MNKNVQILVDKVPTGETDTFKSYASEEICSSSSRSIIEDEFGESIKFVLEGGRSKVGLESTIVSLLDKPQILRLGGVEIDKIKKIIKINLKVNHKIDKMLMHD